MLGIMDTTCDENIIQAVCRSSHPIIFGSSAGTSAKPAVADLDFPDIAADEGLAEVVVAAATAAADSQTADRSSD